MKPITLGDDKEYFEFVGQANAFSVDSYSEKKKFERKKIDQLGIYLILSTNNQPVKKLRGTCVACQKNNSPTEGDQTIQAEGLGDFCNHLGKPEKNVGKAILNNPEKL